MANFLEQRYISNQFVSKKQYALTVAFLLLLTLILFLAVYFSLNNRIDENYDEIKNINIPVYKETAATEVAHTFLVKEFNNCLAVYKDGDLQYTVDVCFFALPEADKKLLSCGIEVSTEQELNAILSCYY